MRRSIRSAKFNPENKTTLKTLTVATIVGLSIIGVGQAQATTLDEVDLSQKPIDTPTLDYLHKNDVLLPQKTFQRDDEYGYIVTNSNWEPITEESTPILAPQSGYSLTKLEAKEDGSKPDGDNVITKFEVKEVTRYYDKTTGELVANPISGVEYKVVQEKDLVPHYYSVNAVIPELNNSKVTWTEVTGEGNNTTEIYTLNGRKYYKYTYNTPSNYDTTTNSDKTKDFGTITNPTGTYKDPTGGSAINNPAGSTITLENYVFQNNKTTADFKSTTSGGKYVNLFGGAIYNEGEISKITSDFIGNSISTTESSSYGYINAKAQGGAIYNNGKIGDITGDFINNSADMGGAIYNSGTIGNISGDFIDNKTNYGTSGVIHNIGTIGDISGNFVNGIYGYSSRANIIYNENGTIGNITGNFVNGRYAIYNENGKTGNIKGNFFENRNAIYNTNGAMGDIKANFFSNEQAILNEKGIIGNITGDIVNNSAGIINKQGTIGNITGDFFNNKTGSQNSGVIYNNEGTIGDITGDFINNRATNFDTAIIYNVAGTIGNIAGDFIGNIGDIIYNNGDSIGNITGDFINNFSKNKESIINNREQSIIGDITGNFIENSRAIGNYGSIDNITGYFGGNSTYTSYYGGYTSGGAICNYGTIKDITGYFINNHIDDGASGGAIGNGGFIDNITGDFVGNYAYDNNSGYYSDAFGGAISNSGVIKNITGNFINNHVSADSSEYYYNENKPKIPYTEAMGGAIYNNGGIQNLTGNFIGNYATINDLDENSKAYGGAIASVVGDTNKTIEIYYQKSTITNTNTGESITVYVAFSEDANPDNFTLQEFINKANSLGYKIEFVQGEDSVQSIENENEWNSWLETMNEFKDKGYASEKDITQTVTINNDLIGLTIKNSNFFNNFATSDSSEAKGGAIYTNRSLNIIADNGESIFSGNYVQSPDKKDQQAVYVENTFTKKELGFNEDRTKYLFQLKPSKATLTLKSINNGKIIFNDKITGGTTTIVTNPFYIKDKQIHYTDENYNDTDVLTEHSSIPELKITGDSSSVVQLNNNIENMDISLSGTNLHLGARDNVLDGNNLYLQSGTLSMVNNQAGVASLNNVTLSGNTNFVADVDLANAKMDRITATNYGTHQGKLNVVGMNLLSDSTKDVTEIYFAQQGLKDNVVNGMPANGGYNLPSSAQTTFYTPIYKYNAIYDNRDDGGYFMFAKGDKILTPSGGGGITVTPTGNPSNAFNPSVLAPSVASQAGANATMNQTFNYAFQNSDNFMALPYLERVAIKTSNRYALSPTGDATDVGTFSPLFNTMNETSSAWVKPYASFENIPLKNGPKVSNITYGTLVGFDSPIKSIRHGWDRTWTGYVGYNGASQRFSGVDATQNGGLVGGTLTLYKGNFFNATTISSGAIVGDNRTMYGTDNYTMLMAGVGNKTGYNFEFKEGKIIIQPSMLLSYTFVNTFDYTNAAGVRIKNDPLHAIQIAPGVKFIANTKNGWQPYIGVNMIWNLLDKSKVSANDVRLPEMSIKPYVQYGVGVQKRFKDRYMAFGQAMIQNGGRNGISLTAGFRWTVGKEGKPLEKVQRVNNKTISSSSGVQAKSTIAQAQPERKIIKQLSQTQREKIAKQYQNTTRTTFIGEMKKL